MLKNILNLEGAQQLSKKEQNAIHGGSGYCIDECGNGCPENSFCMVFHCNELMYMPDYGVCISNGGDH